MRRRAAEELLEFVAWYLDISSRRAYGYAVGWGGGEPGRKAFNQAVYRLRKAGLVVSRSGGSGATPALSPGGEKHLRPVHHPRRWWRQRWNGFWYVLVYDVPEKNRSFRNVLRRFLQQQRMGCLQRSVYVTPRDIRPVYDDLLHGADVGPYACLFESRTVLGMEPAELVARAWDFERLNALQRAYCDLCEENLFRMSEEELDPTDLGLLAQEEMAAYVAVMTDDPLLPRELLPSDYEGEAAYKAHHGFVRALSRRL